MSERRATVTRETAETAVEVTLDVDGRGDAEIDTGIPFFDHVLEGFATHGCFDLAIACDGDLAVDDHHSVEDVGLAVGAAFDDALGDRSGIRRMADRRVPMDEAIAELAIDVSGRPHLVFEGTFSQDRVGGLTSVMARHFLRSVATTAGLTVHAEIRGANAHHEIEALFKAVGVALDDATRLDERRAGPPSTKGEL